jgi:hypothetical protein
MTRFDDSEIKEWLREIRIEKIDRILSPRIKKTKLNNRGFE